MKITQTAYVIATAVSTTNAISLRGLFKKQHQQHTAADIVDDNSDEAWDAADTDTTAIVHNKHRELEYNLYPGTNCQDLGDGAGPPAPRWYPNYSVAWSIGRKYHIICLTFFNAIPIVSVDILCSSFVFATTNHYTLYFYIVLLQIVPSQLIVTQDRGMIRNWIVVRAPIHHSHLVLVYKVYPIHRLLHPPNLVI